jgi:hypothetical protein
MLIGAYLGELVRRRHRDEGISECSLELMSVAMTRGRTGDKPGSRPVLCCSWRSRVRLPHAELADVLNGVFSQRSDS